MNNTCISQCPSGYKADADAINCIFDYKPGTGGNGGNGGNGNNGTGGLVIIGSNEDYVDTNNKTYVYFTT